MFQRWVILLILYSQKTLIIKGSGENISNENKQHIDARHYSEGFAFIISHNFQNLLGMNYYYPHNTDEQTKNSVQSINGTAS